MKRRTENSLPPYATQTRITAKRYYRTEHRLFALNWLVSLRHCHDMLRKRCHNIHEIAPGLYFLPLLVILKCPNDCPRYTRVNADTLRHSPYALHHNVVREYR